MEDEEEVKSSVIYVGNLPKVITESQIKAYFNQFGKVVKIRLMKSKKTNNSRGYCYVKFETPKIASIAAEAMNNYFIDGRVLKVNLKEKTQNVKHLFKKGMTPPSSKTRLMLRAMKAHEDNQRVEAKIQEIIRAAEQKEPVQLDEDVEQIRAHLKSAITRMEKKQAKLDTDIYEEPIKKYRAVLEMLPAPKE